MPAGLSGTGKVTVSYYMDIADPNSHLYIELMDGAVLLQTLKDVNASSTPNAVGAWQRETFDVSSLVHGRGQVALRFRAVTGATTPATFYVDDVVLDIRQLVPKYWDPAYLNAYKTFITALGKRYAGDPRVQFVAMGTGMGGENQPSDQRQDYVFATAGLTLRDLD